GTNSPSRTLDIVDNGGILRLKNKNSDITNPEVQLANIAGTGYLWLDYDNGEGKGHIGMVTPTSSGRKEVITINHTGKVGIGT
ncbi:hypothetical protein, partial [Xanthovirga aplysinae]|uniref:hypothetical protein n=1 Tax=Xanthovirga aplysinae TaxID=2529853 RepID=UPI001656A0AF